MVFVMRVLQYYLNAHNEGLDYRCTPKPLMDSIMSPKGENNKRIRSWGTLPASQHFGGKKACWSSEMGIRKSDKQVTHTNLHKPNKLVSA
jgi:hypothetical protein